MQTGKIFGLILKYSNNDIWLIDIDYILWKWLQTEYIPVFSTTDLHRRNSVPC